MDKLTHYTETIRRIPNAQAFDTWLLEQARDIPPEKSIQLRVPANYIRGCEFATWVAGYNTQDGWVFEYDSDSKITRALAEMVVSVCNGKSNDEIRNLKFSDFVGITTYLPHNRKKGVQLLLNRIHNITH